MTSGCESFARDGLETRQGRLVDSLLLSVCGNRIVRGAFALAKHRLNVVLSHVEAEVATCGDIGRLPKIKSMLTLKRNKNLGVPLEVEPGYRGFYHDFSSFSDQSDFSE